MKKCAISVVAAPGMGLGAASAMADTVNARSPRAAPHPENVFTRMFPTLSPFARQTDAARKSVQQMGAIHGIFDAGDNLTDPIQSIINPGVFSPTRVFAAHDRAGPARPDPARAPNWKPTLPASAAGDIRMADLLRFAGVVAAL